jgi:hypothetical protein
LKFRIQGVVIMVGIRNPRFGIRNPQKGIQNPRFGIRNPQNGIQNPRFGIWNPVLQNSEFLRTSIR